MNLKLLIPAIVLLALGVIGSIARAEVELSIFTGIALTQDSDLRLQQNSGTDLTFRDVSFAGRDFETPPYYGARLLWFSSEDSHWGFGAEFFHSKLYADTGDTVRVTGRRNGAGVNANEPIDDTIESFSLSHGLNYALGDIVYRSGCPAAAAKISWDTSSPTRASGWASRSRMSNPTSTGHSTRNTNCTAPGWKCSRA